MEPPVRPKHKALTMKFGPVGGCYPPPADAGT